MKKTVFFILLFLAFSCFAQEEGGESPYLTKDVIQALRQVKNKHLNLSIINLLATPERYDGEMVQVRGFIHMEAGNDAIYIHSDDYKYKILANGLWIEFNEKFSEKKNRLDYNDKYVIIIGEFKAGDKGKNDMFSGSIKNIIRIDESTAPHK